MSCGRLRTSGKRGATRISGHYLDVDRKTEAPAETGHKPCILGSVNRSPPVIDVRDGDVEPEASLECDEAAREECRVRTAGDGGNHQGSAIVSSG